MTGLFRPHYSFLTMNSWQRQAQNALRYNTSQVGSVLPMIYGTIRQQINLLALANYRGTGGGKKGKGVGPLPIGGTNQTAKGGGGGKKGGKKRAPDFTVDFDAALCEGPATMQGGNWVFASSQVDTFAALPLHFYAGTNGQAPDPTAAEYGAVVGYSGTCHVTATPIDLGPNPMLPNFSFEVGGFLAGSSNPSNGRDADPGQVILHFLTDPQCGAMFPLENIDQASLNNFSVYCNAIGFGISTALDAQQTGLEWLNGFMQLFSSTMVWSGNLLRFVPFSETVINVVDPNGTPWTPNLVSQYSLTDDDFLREKIDIGGDIGISNVDPIMMTRKNAQDIPNWMSIQYTDRANYYNTTVLSVFDQSAIDLYGLRLGDSLQGKQFSSEAAAGAAAQTILQRLQYARNTYKFKLPWKYCLLDPMDCLTLTSTHGDNYLNNQPVRITSIEEDDNGDLTIEAEEISVGSPHPVTTGGAGQYATYLSQGTTCTLWTPFMNRPMTNIGGGQPSYLDAFEHPDMSEDVPQGTLSVWIKPQLGGMQLYKNSGTGQGGTGFGGKILPTDVYTSIWTCYAGGAVEWDGMVRDGTTIVPDASPTDPLYCWLHPEYPPLAFGFFGDGTFQLEFAEYERSPGFIYSPGGGGGFGPWNPWMVHAASRQVSDPGRIGFGFWQHVYLDWDLHSGSISNLYINGNHVQMYFDETYHPIIYEELISQAPTVVGYHGAYAGGFFCANDSIFYEMHSIAGCFTDCWFIKGQHLGGSGWRYFMNPSTRRAVVDLGQYGEKPLIEGGLTAGRPDIYYRNIIGTSGNDVFFGGSANHAQGYDGLNHNPPVPGTAWSPYDPHIDGWPGTCIPVACTDGPW